jgi:hypothetical protein
VQGAGGWRHADWAATRAPPDRRRRHRKLESMVRRLGMEVDDALALSEQVDL